MSRFQKLLKEERGGFIVPQGLKIASCSGEVHKNYLNLALTSIDLKDDRFRISYFFSLERLIASIKKIGLIHPPLVTLRGNRFVLVSGWKRVLACKALRLSSLEANLLEEKDDLEAFLAAFYENLTARDFTLLEKAEIIAKLKKLGEEENKVKNQYLPLLHIPPTPYYIDLFMAISSFETKVKKAIQEKNMSLTTIKILAEYQPEEMRLMMPVIKPLGQNKQREILEDLQELSKKNGIAVKKIFAAREIHAWLNSRKLSPLQRSEKVRLALRKMRYPCLSLWKDSFNAALKKVQWPKGVSVEPSPFFEEDRLSFMFSAKNEGDFRAMVAQLQKVSSTKKLKLVFHPQPASLGSKKKK